MIYKNIFSEKLIKKTALLVMLLGAVGADAHAADTPMPRLITVQGECLRSLMPDRASLELTANVLRPQSAAASREAQRLYEETRTLVRSLNLPNLELQTTAYSVQPEYDWVDGKQKQRGIRARVGLNVTTSDPASLGALLDKITPNDELEIGQLQSFVASTTLQTERQSCLLAAASHAKSKAEALAKALNAEVAEVFAVNEIDAPSLPRPPMPYAKTMAIHAEAASLSNAPVLETKGQDLMVTLSVTFRLR